jgi:hypothetical protein
MSDVLEKKIKISTEADTSGAQAARESLEEVSKTSTEAQQQTQKQSKLSAAAMKRLVGAAALVTLAFKAIKAVASYIASGIKDAMMANETFKKNVEKTNEAFGKLKSYVADSVLDLVGIGKEGKNFSFIAVGIANVIHNWITLFKLVINAIKVIRSEIEVGVTVAIQKVMNLLISGMQKIPFLTKEAKQGLIDYQKELEKNVKTAKENQDIAIAGVKTAAEKLGWNKQILENQVDYAKELERQKQLEKEREEAAKKAAEAEKARIKEYQDAVMRMYDASRERQIEFTAELATTHDITDIYVELERQHELNQKLIEAKLQYYEKDSENYRLALEERSILEREYANKNQIMTQELSEFQMNALKTYKDTQTANFKNTKEILDNLSFLSESKNKDMARVGKGIAIAQATINTYEGATKALSQGGIYGVVLAASVIAAGMAQIAQIQGVALAKGGLVRATTGGVPAIIGEGGSDEAVIPLNSSTMNRLGNAIGDNVPQSSGNNISIQQTITIENGQDIESITAALRAGTLEALEFANLTTKVGNSQSSMAV